RRAGGKAHGGGAGFLGGRVMKVAPSLREKIFVVLRSRRQSVLLVFHHKNALDLGFVCELLPQGEQHIVDDKEAILSVIHDKCKLMRMEPQVERVHDSSRGGNSKISFDMRVMVPAQCGDAIARREAGALQGFSERPGPVVEIAVGVTMNAAIG